MLLLFAKTLEQVFWEDNDHFFAQLSEQIKSHRHGKGFAGHWPFPHTLIMQLLQQLRAVRQCVQVRYMFEKSVEETDKLQLRQYNVGLLGPSTSAGAVPSFSEKNVAVAVAKGVRAAVPD